MTKSAAKAALEQHFKVSVSYDFDDTVSAGKVISQNPSAGNGQYPAGTPVQITVSEGKGVLVPDVTGETILQDAIAAIKNAGLKPSPSSSTDTTVTITSTDPAAGTRVVKGTTVTIKYSTSP